MHDEGRFSITARLLLTEIQRERLLALCQQRHADVADVITEIIGNYLDHRQDLSVASVAAPPASPEEREALHRHLRQLRMQASRLGPETPPWLRQYIAELEQEIAAQR
jgi:predicted DNA-binding protein